MPSLDPAAILKEISRIWQTSPPDSIAQLIGPYFAEEVVMVAPSLARVSRGRAAAAETYADFVRTAKVLEVEIDDPEVDLYQEIAIATMPWSVAYEFGGRTSRERGFDTYVFCRKEGTWQICWRSMMSAQQP